MHITDIIETTEFQHRLDKVRRRMDAEGFELLIITDPCNIYYLTGYDGWSFYTPQALIVFLNEAPLLIARKMDIPGIAMSTWLGADRLIGYDETLVQSPDGHPFDVVADEIIKRFQGRAFTAGIESESYYFSVRAFRLLCEKLTAARFIDSGFLVNWVRFIKSPAELDLMRQAGALLTKNMMMTIEAIRSGVPERHAVSAAYASNIDGFDDYGGSYSSSPAFLLSGERIKTPHLPWTDAKVGKDTQINLELMGNRLRYQCTMGRTVYVGEPPAKLRELEKIVCDAIDEVVSALQPGVTCHDVADGFYKFLNRHGIEKDSRCGYSLGIVYPPTGGELTASFRRGDKTVLQEGAAMHFLPAIWSDDVSIIISEPLVITEQGCELLCTVPRQLFVND
ncbi:MAG: Xaa-Pro peptidase family protein [Pseudomonadota bacterium]